MMFPETAGNTENVRAWKTYAQFQKRKWTQIAISTMKKLFVVDCWFLLVWNQFSSMEWQRVYQHNPGHTHDFCVVLICYFLSHWFTFIFQIVCFDFCFGWLRSRRVSVRIWRSGNILKLSLWKKIKEKMTEGMFISTSMMGVIHAATSCFEQVSFFSSDIHDFRLITEWQIWRLLWQSSSNKKRKETLKTRSN